MLKAIDNAVLRAVAALANLGAQLRNERGQDLLEYALIGGGVAAAIVGALIILSPAVEQMAQDIASCITFNGNCAAGP